MLFFLRKKCKFRKKKFAKNPKFCIFRHPKMTPFQQCISVTAVQLFYEILRNSSKHLTCTFLRKITRQLNIGHPQQLLSLIGITLWVGVNYYIPECHMVKFVTHFMLFW